MRKYKATAALVLVSMFFLLYRVFVYQYPTEKPRRNPADYVCDVLGFSYHFVMLAFDARHTGLVSDLHAREALRYKPTDTYMKQYVRTEGAPR